MKYYISRAGFLCREDGWIIAGLKTECSNTPKKVLREVLKRLNQTTRKVLK